jgi:hypothetical protein
MFIQKEKKMNLNYYIFLIFKLVYWFVFREVLVKLIYWCNVLKLSNDIGKCKTMFTTIAFTDYH